MIALLNRSFTLWIAALVSVSAATPEKKETPAERRLHNASVVFEEILFSGDRAVPQSVRDAARCVVIIPAVANDLLKVGAPSGKGFLACRTADLTDWSAPAAVQIDGSSADSDLILIAVNGQAASVIMRPQFILDLVTPGPTGNSTILDVQAGAPTTEQIFAWSRTRGVLRGVALSGLTLKQDPAGNRELYGRTQDNQDIVSNQTQPPRGSHRLSNALNRFSPETTGEKH